MTRPCATQVGVEGRFDRQYRFLVDLTPEPQLPASLLAIAEKESRLEPTSADSAFGRSMAVDVLLMQSPTEDVCQKMRTMLRHSNQR